MVWDPALGYDGTDSTSASVMQRPAAVAVALLVGAVLLFTGWGV
jgi:hypothetical protein